MRIPRVGKENKKPHREREWQITSRDPFSLIGHGYQNFIGMKKIGEN